MDRNATFRVECQSPAKAEGLVIRVSQNRQHCPRCQIAAPKNPDEYTISNLAHDLHHQTAVSGPNVEVSKQNLLPGAQRKLSIKDGHGK